MPITDFGSPAVSALYFRAPVGRIVEDESYYEPVKFTIQVPVPVLEDSRLSYNLGIMHWESRSLAKSLSAKATTPGMTNTETNKP